MAGILSDVGDGGLGGGDGGGGLGGGDGGGAGGGGLGAVKSRIEFVPESHTNRPDPVLVNAMPYGPLNRATEPSPPAVPVDPDNPAMVLTY